MDRVVYKSAMWRTKDGDSDILQSVQAATQAATQAVVASAKQVFTSITGDVAGAATGGEVGATGTEAGGTGTEVGGPKIESRAIFTRATPMNFLCVDFLGYSGATRGSNACITSPGPCST